MELIMFKNFVPDYQNIVDVSYNRKPNRIPIYDHNISPLIMEKIINKKFDHLLDSDTDEFFKNYNYFCKYMGYDVVTYEGCVNDILPNGGALGGHKEGCIKTMEDFNNYPWESISQIYFEKYSPYFEALRRQMPEGMKAIGGVGNGIFEFVQDLTGYTNLCYIRMDDPDLYQQLFKKAGEVLFNIWTEFLLLYGDIYCVCRIGDDLGFHSATLLSEEDIRAFIIPEYKKIIDLVHNYNKPFLLHSCGCIFNIMDDLIDFAKIDSKHSNEDSIAEFHIWVDKYGDKIGNFGGIDTNVLCDIDTTDLESYVSEIVKIAENKNGGVAIGSGNSIPEYVSVERYVKAVNIIRKLRGDL